MGLHRYLYAWNQPTTFTDPTGLKCDPDKLDECLDKCLADCEHGLETCVIVYLIFVGTIWLACAAMCAGATIGWLLCFAGCASAMTKVAIATKVACVAAVLVAYGVCTAQCKAECRR